MTTTQSTGTVIQSWVTQDLARELKLQATAEDRSSSALIRRALTAYLAQSRERPS